MTTIRLIHAGISAIFGYSAFIAFIVLKNYPSAVLGLIAGITDSVSFFLHYLLRKGKLLQWYSPTDLRIICRYAIIVGTAGLLSLGYFTTIQIMYKKPILPVPYSCVISIVWSIIALRSGIFLMYYSICYQRVDETEPLIQEDQNNVEAIEEDQYIVEEDSHPITHSECNDQS